MTDKKELKNYYLAEKYQQLKYSLSKNDWKDGNEYSDSKTTFIISIKKMLEI